MKKIIEKEAKKAAKLRAQEELAQKEEEEKRQKELGEGDRIDQVEETFQGARGQTKVEESKDQYFCLFFGCSPSVGVDKDTKMMMEICSELYFGYDNNMTCTFPAVLENMKSVDANIELVTSSTIRPCRIFYSHNVITDKIAFIITQTHLKGLEEWWGTE